MTQLTTPERFRNLLLQTRPVCPRHGILWPPPLFPLLHLKGLLQRLLLPRHYLKSRIKPQHQRSRLNRPNADPRSLRRSQRAQSSLEGTSRCLRSWEGPKYRRLEKRSTSSRGVGALCQGIGIRTRSG